MVNKSPKMIQMRNFFVFILLLAVFMTGCSNSPSNANSQGASSSEINRNMVPEPIDEKSLALNFRLLFRDSIFMLECCHSRDRFNAVHHG